MNDRARAIDLLRRARDLLAERMTERILEGTDEILEDALGLSYGSEIEAIYEQIGMRLAHVNQLLSNLPAEEDMAADSGSAADPAAQSRAAEKNSAAAISGDWLRTDAEEKIPAPHLALPAPGEPLLLAGPSPVVEFQRFARHVVLGDLDSAGRLLGDLFELEPARARRCTQVFYDGVRHNPEMLAKAGQLRRHMESGVDASALLLLHDCFGLEGIESVSVMQSLKARWSRGM